MTELLYKHVHEKFRHVVGMSNEERIQFIQSPRWIGYGDATEVIDMMQGLMNHVRQPRMPNLLLIGESNNGKTTIIQHFYKKFGGIYNDDLGEMVVPIRSIQAPPSANEKEFYIAIIASYQVPYNPSASTVKLRYQVIHLFREMKTKMLIVDEIHSMLSGTARQQRQIMNSIKFLCNELQIPIVLAGTKDAVRILHTDPQHASRFDVAELPLWRNDAKFQRLIVSFESTLPLKNHSRLADPVKINLIHSISGGCIGNVKRLLAECAIEAIKTGTEEITREIIEGKKCLKPTKGLRKVIG